MMKIGNDWQEGIKRMYAEARTPTGTRFRTDLIRRDAGPLAPFQMGLDAGLAFLDGVARWFAHWSQPQLPGKGALCLTCEHEWKAEDLACDGTGKSPAGFWFMRPDATNLTQALLMPVCSPCLEGKSDAELLASCTEALRKGIDPNIRPAEE